MTVGSLAVRGVTGCSSSSDFGDVAGCSLPTRRFTITLSPSSRGPILGPASMPAPGALAWAGFGRLGPHRQHHPELYFAAGYAHETPKAPDLSGAFHLCALGRIRTCNLLIRSQMLYPLSYECLCSFVFVAVLGPAGPLAATGRTLHDCRRHVKSVCCSPCDLRKRGSEGPGRAKPRSGGPGLR